MVKQTLQRGFTLIELLVVIAIIGILAAVVLTSLSGAQEGAQNSNVQQSMGSIRSAAQLSYNESSFSYDNVCETTSDAYATLDGLATSLNFINDTISTNSDGADDQITCNDSATEYAVSAPLLIDGAVGTSWWCVDSTGFQGEVSAEIAAATVCP